MMYTPDHFRQELRNTLDRLHKKDYEALDAFIELVGFQNTRFLLDIPGFNHDMQGELGLLIDYVSDRETRNVSKSLKKLESILAPLFIQELGTQQPKTLQELFSEREMSYYTKSGELQVEYPLSWYVTRFISNCQMNTRELSRAQKQDVDPYLFASTLDSNPWAAVVMANNGPFIPEQIMSKLGIPGTSSKQVKSESQRGIGLASLSEELQALDLELVAVQSNENQRSIAVRNLTRLENTTVIKGEPTSPYDELLEEIYEEMRLLVIETKRHGILAHVVCNVAFAIVGKKEQLFPNS